jgi:DNA-binding transcriptional ArsR family regulator
VISVRMGMDDLQRTRFVHSPLLEVAESLWIVLSGRVQPVHRGWHDSVRSALGSVDLELLEVLIPAAGTSLADFLLPTATDGPATIEQQLQAIADLPVERLHRALRALWGDAPSPRAREVAAAGTAGLRRIADAMWEYWTIALWPHWHLIRAAVDEDVAYRAAVLARKGMATMFAGLHHKVRLDGETLRLSMSGAADRELSGGGLRLAPSVFAWPFIVFDVTSAHPSSLVYPARGIGDLWSTPGRQDDDALAALLGRNRALILTALARPQPTTTLAAMLDQSPSSVSQHLAILRRCGLVTSWRSGRFVFYQRTDLGASVVKTSREQSAVDAAVA